jgi:hypothetical protein
MQRVATLSLVSRGEKLLNVGVERIVTHTASVWAWHHPVGRQLHVGAIDDEEKVRERYWLYDDSRSDNCDMVRSGCCIRRKTVPHTTVVADVCDGAQP